MKASRNALIPLICFALIAVDLAAGGVAITTTGSNTATGVANVEGDIFTLQPDAGSLYSGVWAHVYVPSGNGGLNAGDSERTVPARTDTRTINGADDVYNLVNDYGATTVIAKASKTGVLGQAEAFSEVSSLSSASDVGPLSGVVSGYSQLAAFATHSGTGTANASADGSADYLAQMKTGEIQATGSVSGSAALDLANNYGGTVTGAALKASTSNADSSDLAAPKTASESFEYLSLTSGRNAQSAVSTIDGIVAGDTSASGFFAYATEGEFGNTESSSTGDLSSTATTYKLGDNIVPGPIGMAPSAIDVSVFNDMLNQNGEISDITKTTLGEPLYMTFLGGTFNAPTASAYLLSQSAASWSATEADHTSTADTESFTSAGVTRTLVDSNEAYGASYLDAGAVSATADTASAPGKSPITLASASVDTIFMGSGAHLVSRLAGLTPLSAADLMISSSMAADGTGSIEVTGNANQDPVDPIANDLVRVVGPLYSPSGTSADATGSYLTAANIDGTAVHIADTDAGFTADSQLIADDISEVNIWSWIAGDDPRVHAESVHGLTPFVATPVYTASPAGPTGLTTGPKVTQGLSTLRSVDTTFDSIISSP